MTKVITMSGSTYEIFKKDSKLFLSRISNHCANSEFGGPVKNTEEMTLEIKEVPRIEIGERMHCKLSKLTPYGNIFTTTPVKEVIRS